MCIVELSLFCLLYSMLIIIKVCLFYKEVIEKGIGNLVFNFTFLRIGFWVMGNLRYKER